METYKLVKGNRVITVKGKTHADSYLKRGYDQIDEKGNIITSATGGKTVSIAEYNRLLDKIRESDSEGLKEELKKLKKKYDEIVSKTEEFAERGKQLQEENIKLKKELNDLKAGQKSSK